jgi:hyperosmotically inducible protein
MKNKPNHFLSIFVATSALIVTNTSLTATESDDRIEASAKSSYIFRTFLKNDSVKTESKDGAVTLTGTVAHGFHKVLAQDTVASIPAVKSVDNHLTVEADSPAENSDKWLSQKVRTSLLFHRHLINRKTEVAAKDGVVSLQGEATSQAQKELITEHARDIEGVKNVKNEMTVSDSRTEPDRTLAEKIDDASITAQIKTSLLTHRSTSALNTRIETRESLVTVSGIAKNASEKSLVTKLITDIDGVSGVTNNMTIRETP